MPGVRAEELVFVVDVSSFTKEGFEGSVMFEGKPVELEFDSGNKGVFLLPGMAQRIHVRKGSKVSVVVEDVVESNTATVGGVGKALRISNAGVYYAVGRGGGAVLRIRKA